MKKITLLILTILFLTITSVQATEININQDNYMTYLTDDNQNIQDGDILIFESNTDLNNHDVEIKKNITLKKINKTKRIPIRR